MQDRTVCLPALQCKNITPFTASLCPQPGDLPWAKLQSFQNWSSNSRRISPQELTQGPFWSGMTLQGMLVHRPLEYSPEWNVSTGGDLGSVEKISRYMVGRYHYGLWALVLLPFSKCQEIQRAKAVHCERGHGSWLSENSCCLSGLPFGRRVNGDVTMRGRILEEEQVQGKTLEECLVYQAALLRVVISHLTMWLFNGFLPHVDEDLESNNAILVASTLPDSWYNVQSTLIWLVNELHWW